MRDIALARLTGAPRPLPAPVDGRHRSRWCGRPRPAGLPVTAEATPAPLHADRRVLRRLRPGVQGEPAAAHRRRRGRRQGRAGRRRHRRHRHRPRPARARTPRSGRSTRRRRACSASRRRWRWRSPSSTCPSSVILALLSWQPAAIAGARRDATAAPIVAGSARQPVRHRPDGDVDGRSGPAGQPQPQHALRRAHADRAGPPHRLSAASPSSSTARRSDDARRDHRDARCSCWPTARRSRARPSAPSRPAASPPARSCSTPCCPATRRSSPTRPTPGRSSRSPTPTSATTASRPADDESARPFCRGVIVRDLARRRSNWRSDGDLDAFLRRHGVPGIAGVDTRRLTRHIREAGRHARRVRHRRRGRR